MSNLFADEPQEQPQAQTVAPKPHLFSEDPDFQPQHDVGSPTPWQSLVKPTQTFNGKQSVKRPDGAVWYGPEQGNTGKPGWFDEKGNRSGDANGEQPRLNFFGGVNARLANMGENIMQTISQASMGHMEHAQPGNPIEKMNAQVAQNQAGRETHLNQSGYGAKIGSAITEPAVIGTALALGQPEFAEAGLGEVAPGMTGMVPATAMQRVAANALPVAGSTYATTQGTPAEKTQAAANTALLAGPGQVIGEGLGAGVQKANQVINGKLPEALQSIQDLADKWHIKIRAGDLSKNAQTVEEGIGRIPLSGQDAAASVTQRDADLAAQSYVSQLKSKVMGEGTPSEIQMQSARKNAAADNFVGHEIYQAGEKLAGSAQAPRNNTISEMQTFISKEGKKSKPDQALIDDLNDRIRRLTQTSAEAIKAGETPMDKSYGGIKDLVSEFYEKANEFEKGTREYAMYSRLGAAARQDMQDFADNSGNEALKSVTKLGNDWWHRKVKDYSPDSRDYAMWAKNLRGKDLDPEHVQDFFDQAGQAGKAKYFYNGLDENGRAAVKWGLANDAYKFATKADASGIPSQGFSPKEWANYLRAHSETSKVFFQGNDAKELAGFNNLMSHIERAGSAGSTIKTGWGALMPYIGVGEASGVAAAMIHGQPAEAALAMAPSVVARLAKPLFTTETGKRLLLGAAYQKVGSKAFDNMVQSQIPRVMTAGAGMDRFQKTTNPPEQPSPVVPQVP